MYIPKDQRYAAYDKLPDKIRDFISSGVSIKKSEEIARQFSLNDTQAIVVDDEIMLVLMGLQSEDDMIVNLQEKAGLPRNKCVEIVIEASKSIFQEFRSIIPKKEKDSAAGAVGEVGQPPATNKPELQNKGSGDRVSPVMGPREASTPTSTQSVPHLSPQRIAESPTSDGGKESLKLPDGSAGAISDHQEVVRNPLAARSEQTDRRPPATPVSAPKAPVFTSPTPSQPVPPTRTPSPSQPTTTFQKEAAPNNGQKKPVPLNWEERKKKLEQSLPKTDNTYKGVDPYREPVE